MKSFFPTILITLLLLAGSALGVQAQTKDEGPMTNAEVIKLVKAGFKEKTVILIISSRLPDFDLSSDRMIQLKRAGVSENIRGGTQYMKELMDLFGGKVDLVLASYNAGEGAVLKYGRSVPPYRETRDYVKTIGKRYGLTGRQQNSETDVPEPRR